MNKYLLEISSVKEVENVDYGYSYKSKKEVEVSKSDIYEAISKYLQVKGFVTEIVAVSDMPEKEEL